MPTSTQTQGARLVRRLGPGSTGWRGLVGALVPQLSTGPGAVALGRWESFWTQRGMGCASEAVTRAEGRAHGVGSPRGAPLVFAIETGCHLLLSLYAARYRRALLGGDDRADLPGELGGSRGFGGRLAGLLRAQAFRDEGVANLLEPALFAWPARSPGAAVIAAVRAVAEELQQHPWQEPPATEDLFGPLLLSLTPRARRRATGAFYTPPWLAELVLERVGYAGERSGRLLDPTCGSGVFLAHAVRRLRSAAEATRLVRGIELNPLAVSASRLRYLIALARPGRREPVAVDLGRAVLWGDALFGPIDARALAPTAPWRDPGPVERVVGNPPWINWERLGEAARESIKQHPGGYADALFPHRGLRARGGGAHDDLAGLITYAVADGFLAPGGRLGLVLPLSLFKSARGGEGFRHLGIGARLALSVERVDDLARLDPFPAASGKAALLTATRDATTRYPVPYLRWTPRDGRRVPGADLASVRRRCLVTEELASPVDAARPASAWLTAPPALAGPLRAVAGPSPYRARKGVDTSLNAVFWVRVLGREGGLARVVNAQTRSRTPVAQREALLEPGALFPLLRGRDFDRWRHGAPLHQVLLYDRETGRPLAEALAAERFPRALAYLGGYEDALRRRRIYRAHLAHQPFYACYDIGPYSFSRHKVVWKALADGIRAAVVSAADGRPVLPDHNVVLVPFDDADAAHFLCAVLNSRVCTRFADAYTEWFYSVHLLQNFRVPRYDAGAPLHRELSGLSRRAHRAPALRAGLAEALEATVRALEPFRAWQGVPEPEEPMR